MGAGLRHRTEPASIQVGPHHAEFRNVGHRCRQVELDSGILNDNNYPFSAGRAVGAPDNNEFILMRLDRRFRSRAAGGTTGAAIHTAANTVTEPIALTSWSAPGHPGVAPAGSDPNGRIAGSEFDGSRSRRVDQVVE